VPFGRGCPVPVWSGYQIGRGVFSYMEPIMPSESFRPYLHWFNGGRHVIDRAEYFPQSHKDKSIDSALRQAAARLGVRIRVSVYRDRVIVQSKREAGWKEIAEKR